MRKRTFALLNTITALKYIAVLLDNGIRFEVIPIVDRVDIITPFELAPSDFPNPEWLKGGK